MQVLKIDFTDKHAPKQFSQSLQKTGFAVVKKHPIDTNLIHAIYDEWFDFFKTNTKENYHFHRNTQDGFFPCHIAEKAKGAELKDLKEYFQYYPWGQCPEHLSPNMERLYNQLNALAVVLLGWLESELPQHISQTLSMPLGKMVENSNKTMLRILHYPPLMGNEPEGAIRAAAHEDINLITLLVSATQSGLQVKDNQGQWLNVPELKDSIIVNVGDMLDLATAGFFRSTTHRVINPTVHNQSRLSMPLFLHPRPEVLLSKSKTADEYLHERLLELGVI